MFHRQVLRLREHVSADRERLKKAEVDDQRMREYVLHYNSRNQQKVTANGAGQRPCVMN